MKTVLLLIGFVLAGIQPAEAQQPKRVPRVGYLSSGTPISEATRSDPIRLGLRELGYTEGQNIAIEYRYTEGKVDRAPELAAELVRPQFALGGQASLSQSECFALLCGALASCRAAAPGWAWPRS